MNRHTLFVSPIVLVLAGMLLADSTVTQAAPPTSQPSTMTVKGKFEWVKLKDTWPDLTGTMTLNKDNNWDVTWSFVWKKKAMTYKGVIKGDLKNGKISGTGDTLDGKRKFIFEGTAKDGKWTFDCFEVTRGKQNQGVGELTVQ